MGATGKGAVGGNSGNGGMISINATATGSITLSGNAINVDGGTPAGNGGAGLVDGAGGNGGKGGRGTVVPTTGITVNSTTGANGNPG